MAEFTKEEVASDPSSREDRNLGPVNPDGDSSSLIATEGLELMHLSDIEDDSDTMSSGTESVLSLVNPYHRLRSSASNWSIYSEDFNPGSYNLNPSSVEYVPRRSVLQSTKTSPHLEWKKVVKEDKALDYIAPSVMQSTSRPHMESKKPEVVPLNQDAPANRFGSSTIPNKLDLQKMARPPAAVSESSYLPWNDYFMSLCFLTAARSKDPNTKVGACIVDKENRIISVGYNGFPRNIPDTKLPWGKVADKAYNTKYPYVCHAEMNCIMNGRKANLEDCQIYTTKFPCPECAKLIIQAGIMNVTYADNPRHPEPEEVVVPSRTMFNYAGVTCKPFIPSVTAVNLQMKNGCGQVQIQK